MEDMSLETLFQKFKKGGILYNVEGNTPKEVLHNLIYKLTLPALLSYEELERAVLERETLMPTSIGKGIAVPHPRNPLLTQPDEQFAVIAFLQKPVDWYALDGLAARTVILLASSSARSHLQSLSRVHFLCQQETFSKLLNEQAPEEKIMDAVAQIERVWK